MSLREGYPQMCGWGQTPTLLLIPRPTYFLVSGPLFHCPPQVRLAQRSPSPSTAPVHQCPLPQRFSSGTWLAGSIPLGAVVVPVLSLQLDPSVGLPRPSLGPAYLTSFSLHSLLGSFRNLIASTVLTSPASGLGCVPPTFFFYFSVSLYTYTHTFHILIIQIHFQYRKTRRYR